MKSKEIENLEIKNNGQKFKHLPSLSEVNLTSFFSISPVIKYYHQILIGLKNYQFLFI